MAGQLKHLKNRISSMGKIKKITKTMKMVSASRLRKVVEAKTNADLYYDGLEQVAIESFKDWDASLLPSYVVGKSASNKSASANEPAGSRHLLIVMSGDKGLCGALNSNVFRFTVDHIKKLESQGIEFDILPVGNKAHAYFLSQHPKQCLDIVKLSLDSAFELFEKIMSVYDSDEKVTKIECISPFFISVISQKIKLTNILPFYEKEEFNSKHEEMTLFARDDSFFESNKKGVAQCLDFCSAFYLTSLMTKLLANAITSETGARVMSMDQAHTKCGELLDDIVLEYNRTRQANVTREILEVVAGTEAL